MNTIQKGFTLIELMIVIAIVGILSAVALPMYGDYTARAQAAEGYSLLSGMKTPMVEAVSSSSLANACAAAAAWYTQSVRAGKYVSGIALTKGTGSNATTCQMTATFATTGVNDKVAGKKIGMQFNSSDGTWKCGTDLEPNIAPAACQGTNNLTL